MRLALEAARRSVDLDAGGLPVLEVPGEESGPDAVIESAAFGSFARPADGLKGTLRGALFAFSSSDMMLPVTREPRPDAPVAATASGVEPVFVPSLPLPTYSAGTPGPGSNLSSLVDSVSAPLTPDWDAWAQILALGAPLAGRTPFIGFHRLQPGEIATPEKSDNDGEPGASSLAWQIGQQPWLWEAVEPEPNLKPESLTGDVLDVMRSRIAELSGPLNPMLSGGRDSRLLTALAVQTSSEVTAWTTSSDTGTSMEELVAARIAQRLGVSQRIVPGWHDRFADDVRAYAKTVDYMASFHIWLMPVARELQAAYQYAGNAGTILDGLGGGVFLGGGFPDAEDLHASASAAQVVDSRFTRMARYLEAAEEILAPGVAGELVDRSRADFDPIAHRFADHPNGATLTAYLTRTLPGISMAPSRVLGGAQPTLMPIMDDEVIKLALRVPHELKHDGIWYPHLLATADSRLTEQPTAADLTGRRQHQRRVSSPTAAAWFRELIISSPAGALLSERMRRADAAEWSAQLSKTKPQHLIRGLAMLALWLEEYGEKLTDAEPPFGDGSHG